MEGVELSVDKLTESMPVPLEVTEDSMEKRPLAEHSAGWPSAQKCQLKTACCVLKEEPMGAGGREQKQKGMRSP